jgi:hypothetical protein
MDPVAEKTHVDAITHSEGLDRSSTIDTLGIERVVGRDFTVAEDDLPKGYVRFSSRS